MLNISTAASKTLMGEKGYYNNYRGEKPDGTINASRYITVRAVKSVPARTESTKPVTAVKPIPGNIRGRVQIGIVVRRSLK